MNRAAGLKPRGWLARGGIGWRTALLGLLGLLLAGLPTTFRYARAASLLLQVTQPTSKPLPLLTTPIESLDTTLALPSGTLRARLYRPTGAADAPGVVLLHGVHPRGIDETRLIAFARSLAGAGLAVLTPELPELLEYKIQASTVERIADVAEAHALRLHARSVGVVGISFAGGLALMAADHARAARAIAFVVSLGAHHDLMRLCRYYADQPVVGPAGEKPKVTPHPYGARVLLRQHLERFFEPGDVASAQRVLDTYLHDQHASARKQALGLSESGRRTMAILLEDAHHEELDALLLRAAQLARVELAAASPKGQLAHLRAPVFLIHGETDPVIPSIETRWLAHEIPPAALRRAVITPLLRHAEFPAPPSPAEAWELIALMSGVLREAGATRFRPPRTSP